MEVFRNLKVLATAAALAVVSLAAPASASTTGVFVGTFKGNDPFPDPIFAGTKDESVALYKCDVIAGPGCDESEAPAGDYTSNFTINFTDAKTGTWSFVQGTKTLLPKYIVLKAGPDHSVWNIGGLFSGNWTTVGTLDKDLSHMSFYDSYAAPVPLPAAGLLLVGAIGGLAAMRRRKARA